MNHEERLEVASATMQADIDKQASAISQTFTGESATHCVECEEPIPEARRIALQGVELCVSCKQRSEWHG